MKNLNFFVLAAIVLLAFFLRMYKVSVLPPSLSWDEVSIGYNAYSILKTGHDEHGRYFPLDAFFSYGDYKPPLAIYLTIPFVAIFGLGELAVRLPSVISGTLSVFVLFFFVRELLKSNRIALIASVLLAISPWHIQLSRAGFEANIALLFVLLGSYFLLKKWFIICWVPYVAAMYTFNSARYVVPILAVLFCIYLKKLFLHNVKSASIGILFAFILLLPLVPHLVSKEARLRFSEVNIFTDPSIVRTANERIEADGSTFWAKIIHNRRVGFARSYLLHFFDNLEPKFLFIRGDGNPKFSLQEVGELYAVELPFLILGFIWLFRDHPRIAWLFVGWLIVSIAPAATARETPHALRIENLLPVFLIAIAYGISRVLSRKHAIVPACIVILYAANVSFFWHNYMNHYAAEFSGEWQYGYKQVIAKVQSLKKKYKTVVLSENIGRAYMYVLFYENVDPTLVRQNIEGAFDAAGFYNVTGLGKYTFVRGIESFAKDTLYVLTPREVPVGARVLDTIRLLNGTPALVIFDV